MFKIERLTPEMMKKYRLWLNLSQEEIATELGVAKNTYACWERGDKTPEAGAMLTLAFESLLNRKAVEPVKISTSEGNPETFNGMFKSRAEEFEFFRQQLEASQNFRKRRKEINRSKSEFESK